jgi:hypothetical protein
MPSLGAEFVHAEEENIKRSDEAKIIDVLYVVVSRGEGKQF